MQTEGFIKKEAYYKFNVTLQDHLKKIQSESLTFDIEKMISAITEDTVI